MGLTATGFYETCLQNFAYIAVFLTFLFIVCTSLGKSLGVQKSYASILHKIFEFGKKMKTKKTLEQKELEDEQGDSTNSISDIVQNGKTVPSIPLEDAKQDENGTDDSSSGTKKFDLLDGIELFRQGFEKIVEDEVTIRFEAEELSSWNLLTRTNKNYHQLSKRLTFLWMLGLIFRYFVLLPFRFAIFVGGLMWLFFWLFFLGYIPECFAKKWAYRVVSLSCFRLLGRVFSTTITFHNKENKALNGICVSNHTSPLDALILSYDNCYAMTGQSHGGLLGTIQSSLSRASAHVWFEREEYKDRLLVSNRMKEHINDPTKLPILIFPEGTCINNTSVMRFSKGSFEVSDTIHPVAIKYDPNYGDVFWNSSLHAYFHYILRLMSSWAIVCEVWYLPPMTRKPNEDAIEFANRVKAEIAQQGGLDNLDWDGQLKRKQAKKELNENQQKEFAKRLKLE